MLSVCALHAMKANQLFSRCIDAPTLQVVLDSFGLGGLHDRRSFTKHDMTSIGTVSRLVENAVPRLRQCYIPCKARSYLDGMTDKKALTVLKQVLRQHHHILIPRERSVSGRKVVFYHMEPPANEPTGDDPPAAPAAADRPPASPALFRIDFM